MVASPSTPSGTQTPQHRARHEKSSRLIHTLHDLFLLKILETFEFLLPLCSLSFFSFEFFSPHCSLPSPFLQNYAKAWECYEKAAKVGYTDAIFRMGVCLQHGWGVPRDETKALDFFNLTANRGSLTAMNWLGRYYVHTLRAGFPVLFFVWRYCYLFSFLFSLIWCIKTKQVWLDLCLT